MKKKINPGKGYRLLKKGEIILSTDEFMVDEPTSNGIWNQRDGDPEVGNPFVPGINYPTRRKVEKPKGWNVTVTFPTRKKAREFIHFNNADAIGEKWSGPHKV